MLAISRLDRLQKPQRVLVKGIQRAMANLVEFNVQGTARTVTLARNDKLNALNAQMCKDITPRLEEYSKSKAAKLIVLKSGSDKAFCAGGDVVQASKDNLMGNYNKSLDFFESEYSLNYLLAVYGKPVVTFANGITMGGGVGLSVHNPFRIVCETTRFAMPESSIGFFNDVGTSFWLPKLDSNLGYYLGITGEELSGIDTFLMGFGTHYVPSSRFTALLERLSQLNLTPLAANSSNKSSIFDPNSNKQLYSLINSTIEEFSEEIPIYHKFKYSNDELNTIEKCFNPNINKTIESVIEDLKNDGSNFALKTISIIESKSPLSIKLNWALLNKSKSSSIYESLTRELKLAGKLMTNYKLNDFNQFINHKLINKSNNIPISNQFKTLEKVPSEIIDQLISLDTYSPDENLENSSKIIEDLNKLKISRFDKLNEINNDFIEYPHQMGLPTEFEIKSFVINKQTNFAETVKYFQMKYNDKSGVSYKVKSILNRKTEKLNNGGNDEGDIKWLN